MSQETSFLKWQLCPWWSLARGHGEVHGAIIAQPEALISASQSFNTRALCTNIIILQMQKLKHRDVTFVRSHSYFVAELGFEPRKLYCCILNLFNCSHKVRLLKDGVWIVLHLNIVISRVILYVSKGIFFCLFKYIYWLCYYSCPIPPPLHSILPTPSLPNSPPIVHVDGSYL